MKHIRILIIITACCILLAGCGSASDLVSASSSAANQVISRIRSAVSSSDGSAGSAMSAEADSNSGNQESANNADAEEQTDQTAADGAGDASVSEDPDADPSVKSALDFLKSGSATVADLKSMNLSSLKASPSFLMDFFLNNNIVRNEYSTRLFRHEGNMLYYDDPDYDCALGIDVSFFQGDVDWEAVKAQGISFVFVRVGFRGYGEAGSLNEDPMYLANIEGAKQAGLLVGAYFFSQAINEQEAVREAEFALQLLDGIDLDLPLVFDAEIIRDDDARTDSVNLSQFTQNARAFCQTVSSAGYDAMIYTNLLFEGLIYDLSELSDYPVWYADYSPVPLSPYHFDFWQYTESATLDGIEEPVDMNIWMRRS